MKDKLFITIDFTFTFHISPKGNSEMIFISEGEEQKLGKISKIIWEKRKQIQKRVIKRIKKIVQEEIQKELRSK